MAFFYSVFGIACFLVARSLGTPIFGSCSRSVCEVCGHSGQSCLLGSERVWGSSELRLGRQSERVLTREQVFWEERLTSKASQS